MKKSLLAILLITMVLSLTACNNDVKINNSSDATSNNTINIASNETDQNTSDNRTSQKAVESNNETPQKAADSKDEIIDNQQDSNKEEVNNLLGQIYQEAKEGKVINCKYKIGEYNIQSVFDDFGEVKGEYVSAAKGLYFSYDERKLTFGTNKGGTIFEARTFDPNLKKITLNDALNYFGSLDYDVTTELDERIIGYVIDDDIKLLLVFGNVSASDNPCLDHYSCLAPSHTANSMADDPGREW